MLIFLHVPVPECMPASCNGRINASALIQGHRTQCRESFWGKSFMVWTGYRLHSWGDWIGSQLDITAKKRSLMAWLSEGRCHFLLWWCQSSKSGSTISMKAFCWTTCELSSCELSWIIHKDDLKMETFLIAWQGVLSSANFGFQIDLVRFPETFINMTVLRFASLFPAVSGAEETLWG